MRVSFFLNIAYSVFLFLISQLYFSKWFFVMAIYYALLSVARVFIRFQIHPEKRLRNKILHMRNCGYFLFLLNLAVSVMTFLLIYTSPPVKHHEITVITLAAYTFFTFTWAIVGNVKYLKRNDYVVFCMKRMSLISASVSMVTLTNTMLATWGEGENVLRSITLPLLSVAVCIFIMASAIFIIRKANLTLRTLRDEQERE